MDFEMPKARGENIRDLRTKRGWPQEQLATVASLSLKTIQRADAGSPVSLQTLQALASVLEVSIESLAILKGSDRGIGNSDPQSTPATIKVLQLPRLRTGRELFGVAGGAHTFGFDNVEPSSREEMELIGNFGKHVFEFGEVWGDLDPRQRIEAGFDLTNMIQALEGAGLAVFGILRKLRYSSPGVQDPMPVDSALIVIQRVNNPMITKSGDGREFLPVAVRANAAP